MRTLVNWNGPGYYAGRQEGGHDPVHVVYRVMAFDEEGVDGERPEDRCDGLGTPFELRTLQDAEECGEVYDRQEAPR